MSDSIPELRHALESDDDVDLLWLAAHLTRAVVELDDRLTELEAREGTG